MKSCFFLLAMACAPLIPVSAAGDGELRVKAASQADASEDPPVSSDYELRGFFGVGKNLRVSVARKGEKESAWMRVGRPCGDLLIESADADSGRAILVAGGVRIRLLSATPSETDRRPDDDPSAKLSDAEVRSLYVIAQKYDENLSPDQRLLVTSRIREKLAQLRKESEDAGLQSDRAEIRKVFQSAYLSAIEEASKMPDKNGRISPVPEAIRTLGFVSEERLSRAASSSSGNPEAPETPAGNR